MTANPTLRPKQDPGVLSETSSYTVFPVSPLKVPDSATTPASGEDFRLISHPSCARDLAKKPFVILLHLTPRG